MIVQKNLDQLDALHPAETLALFCEEQRSRRGFFPNSKIKGDRAGDSVPAERSGANRGLSR